MSTTMGFLGYFKDLPDPRQSTKVLYPLDEMLLLCLCGVIAGAESFSGIVDYGEEKLDFLRTLLPFKSGIPAHDTLNGSFPPYFRTRKTGHGLKAHGPFSIYPG